MADDNDVLIGEDGSVKFIYTDLLDQVFAEEARTTVRVSHVEPASQYSIVPGNKGWVADMTPIGGPVLYAGDGNGFETREQALAEERAWLKRERGL